jgi:hypothetical protein
MVHKPLPRLGKNIRRWLKEKQDVVFIKSPNKYSWTAEVSGHWSDAPSEPVFMKTTFRLSI